MASKSAQMSKPKGTPDDAWQLFCAATDGDVALAEQLLFANPELMHHQIWYECPLHYAVRENQIGVVQFLLEAGVNPAYSNFNYSSWQSLLPIAKDRGFDEVHAMLIAEMQKRFNYDPGYEPLWAAIVANDVDTVKSMIEANPDLANIGDEHGNRAIHWAVLARRISIIQTLLDSGANINVERADTLSPLLLSVVGDYWFGKTNQCDANTTGEQVTQFLLDQCAECEFAAAVALGEVDQVKAELAEKPDLAKTLRARRSPLYLAATRGNLQIVRLLLQHGADPNQPEECASRGRALFAASCREDTPMMKLLIEHGADADAYVDSSGNCLSNVADEEAIAILKAAGAMPGEWTLDTTEKVSAAIDDETFVPNRDRWSSILGKILESDDVGLLQKYVARFGTNDIRSLNPSKGWWLPKSAAMLADLLRHGANINAHDWYGRSFLHYAALDETPDRAEWLIAAGIEIDAIDHQSGTTPLGLAAWNGNLAIVDFLLNQGADASLPHESKWAQPLTFAKEQGHNEIVSRISPGKTQSY